MLLKPEQRLEVEDAKGVVRGHPWVLIVSDGPGGLVASHMPAVLDEEAPSGELVLLSHTACADPQTERVTGGAELLVIVQGEHGFLPAAWAQAPGQTGTWAFEAVHLHGTARPLDRAGTLDVVRRTFEHLEAARDEPTPWEGDPEDTAREIVGGIVGFRLPAWRIEAKAKLEQGKPREVRERLIAALHEPGPFHQPRLAARMHEAL